MTNNEQEPLLDNQQSSNSTKYYDVSVEELYEIIENKSTEKLDSLGGVEGLFKKLKSSAEGLVENEYKSDIESKNYSKRQLQFGINKLDEVPVKPFYMLLWEAYQDKTLVMLSVASVVSLGMGIYEDSNKPKDDKEPRVGWVEGVAIIAAVLAVIFTNSINDYQKEKQFRKLNSKRDNDKKIKVKRITNNQSETIEINITDIQTGDIMLIECGDVVPVDGILIKGNNVVMDESSATGESDPIKKEANDKEHEPFILSGSKVQEGNGNVLCVLVGKNSYFGRTMMAMRKGNDSEDGNNGNDITPLQKKLEGLAENIAKIGMAAAILMLISLVIKFWINSLINDVELSSAQIIQTVVKIIIQSITIVVVAVPEGLPMAVTLALAYAATKMIKDNNLVRVLASCETMGNATVICTDKTGTLTKNKMTVVEAFINNKSSEGLSSKTNKMTEFKNKISDHTKNLLLQAIESNSTASSKKDKNNEYVFNGSKTECALLDMCVKIGLELNKNKTEIVKEYPFSSSIKSMSSIIKQDEKTYRIHSKGASEIILKNSSHFLDENDNVNEINEEMRYKLEHTIERFASNALRTIALCYKDISSDESIPEEAPLSNMTLIAIVGIMDPLRDGVKESVEKFRRAGIVVKMITGDNITTAKAIAKNAGIWCKGGVVISGSEFRKLSSEQRMKIVPRMQVLARSSPKDKLLVVKALQQLDEIVAMTGDGTNDGPALKMADVGFSMGITGTEVAKEASAIILMDDNFNSIVNATKWGRAVNLSVRKFLQFQLTVNITAVSVSFISALTNKQNNTESILTTVQLLWVNLIMDTLAALALATEPPTDKLLLKYPTPRNAPLITNKMWKHIIGQSLFQIIVNLLVIQYGHIIVHSNSMDIIRTSVFNIFVFLQVFNEFNCRRIDDEINVFEHMTKNYFFVSIQVIVVVVQFIIVQFGGYAFSTHPLSMKNWIITLGIGLLSLPIGLVLRLLPTPRDSEKQIKKPMYSRERLMLTQTMKDVKTSLNVFNALRRKPRKNTTVNSSNSFSRSNILGDHNSNNSNDAVNNNQ